MAESPDGKSWQRGVRKRPARQRWVMEEPRWAGPAHTWRGEVLELRKVTFEALLRATSPEDMEHGTAERRPGQRGPAGARQWGAACRPSRGSGVRRAPPSPQLPRLARPAPERFRLRTGSPLRQTAGLCALPDVAQLEAVPLACCPLAPASDLPQTHQRAQGARRTALGQWGRRRAGVATHPLLPRNHPICSCPPAWHHQQGVGRAGAQHIG